MSSAVRVVARIGDRANLERSTKKTPGAHERPGV